jgi:formylglycine-generating enzyme required for sulfatase activity
VLLGEHWENALPEWLGSSPRLNRNTQVLVVVPQAAAAEAAVARLASHPGPWAVAVSEDMAGVARKIDFPGSLAIRQVDARWRVQRSQGQVIVYGGPERKEEAGIEWVYVCPGTFTMGRLKGEDALAENAKDENLRQFYQLEIVEPQRTVVLSAFQIAVTETTQQQYGETGTLPKVNINWGDARAFCQNLKFRGALQFRGDLPTEAQWEYAARGGSRFPWSFGDDVAQVPNYAWFADNSADQAHDVGKKDPNPLGLYDMHGNVWEWVRDWYENYEPGLLIDPSGPRSGNFRVVRGGSFVHSPESLRSARRGVVRPEYGLFGFRCVRVPPQP